MQPAGHPKAGRAHAPANRREKNLCRRGARHADAYDLGRPGARRALRLFGVWPVPMAAVCTHGSPSHAYVSACHIGCVTCRYTLFRCSHSASATDRAARRSFQMLLQMTNILPPT